MINGANSHIDKSDFTGKLLAHFRDNGMGAEVRESSFEDRWVRRKMQLESLLLYGQ